jgi:hypothetical protein
MNRRAITRVLLSLLLLITQQFAFAHALSHLAGPAEVASQRHAAGETAKALAQDQTCSQCLAFAQLATPLARAPCAFVAATAATDARAHAVDRCIAARTALAFRARAPPA